MVSEEIQMLELMVLGSGSSVPHKDRGHPALWMRYQGETFLLDCGEGTQRQMIKADLSYAKVDNICVTHWHADHCLGLIGLLRTRDMEAPENPVHVFGPEANARMEMIEGFAGEMENLPLEVTDVPPAGGPVRATPRYEISAFPTDHRSPSFGFVFREKEKWNFDMERVNKKDIDKEILDRLREEMVIRHDGERLAIGQVAERTEGKKVVYTGDTLPAESTVQAAKDADLLIHDATYLEEDRKEGRSHATAREAAEVAKEAGVDRLVLTHFSSRYESAEEHVERAKEVFPNVIAAEDFMRLKVV